MTKYKSKFSPLIILFTALTAIIMLISGLTFLNRNSEQGFADEPVYTSEGLAYTYLEAESGYTVSKGTSTAQYVQIPDTYNDGLNGERPITSIAKNGFYPASIIGLKMPLTCTIIKDYGIGYMRSSLTMVNSDTPGVFDLSHVTYVGERGCTQNTEMTELWLSEDITIIKLRAFEGCENVTKVNSEIEGVMNLPNVTTVEDYGFIGMNYIVKINMPKLTYIGKKGFCSLSALTSFNSDEDVLNLENITHIGNSGFYKCKSVTDIYLRDIEYLDEKVFAECGNNLQNIYVMITDAEKLPSLHFGFYDAFLWANPNAKVYVPAVVRDACITKWWISQQDQLDRLIPIKDPVTLEVDNLSYTKTYGQSDPEFTFTAYDENEVLIELAEGSLLGRVSGEDVGTYSITIGNLEELNPFYEFSFTEQAILTITALEATVVWGETTEFEYNAQEQAPTATAINELGEEIDLTITGAINVGNHIAIASNQNCNLTNAEIPFTITAVTVTVSAAEDAVVEKEYDGTTNAILTTSHYVINGLFTEDIGTEILYAATYDSANVNEATTVTVNVTGIDSENYILEPTQLTLDGEIIQKEIAVVWGETTFEYNGEEQIPTATIETGIENETIEFTVTADNQSINVGNYIATVNLSQTYDNYNITNQTTSFEIVITTITLTVKDITITKEYDGNTTATVTSDHYTLSGDFGDDEIVITIESATYNSKDVSDANLVTVTGLAVENSNYTLSSTTFTIQGEITPKDIAVVWGETTFVYNGEEQKPTATVETGIEDETVLLTVSGEQINAAVDYTATATMTVENSNYNLTNTTTLFSISPKEIAVVWGETTFEYNGEEQIPTATIETGIENETIEFTVTADNQSINVGNYIATVNLSQTYDNYNITNQTTSFEIVITTITLTVKDITITKEYDGNTTATVTSDHYTLSGDFGDDEIVITIESATYNSKDVSDANLVTVTGLAVENSNYTLSSTTFTIQGEITPKDIAVVWGETTFVYNGEEQKPTATVETGIEDETVLLTVSGEQINAAVDYTATATMTVENSNYNLTNTTTLFSISPKEIIVVANAEAKVTKIYDGVTSTNITDELYSITGILESDTVNLTIGSALFNSKNVADANIVTAGNITLDNNNYVLSEETFTVDGEITKRALTISIEEDVIKKASLKIDPEITYTATGLVEGEELEGALSREEGDVVGEYDIIPGTLTGTNNPNYEISYDFENVKFIIEADQINIINIALAIIILIVIALVVLRVVTKSQKAKR
ncbi:MAG: YDG domain-containing protein [Clostridia bacterium]|nr:YDG domain-containing protein [Clostridia bacterium]